MLQRYQNKNLFDLVSFDTGERVQNKNEFKGKSNEI